MQRTEAYRRHQFLKRRNRAISRFKHSGFSKVVDMEDDALVVEYHKGYGITVNEPLPLFRTDYLRKRLCSCHICKRERYKRHGRQDRVARRALAW